MKTKVLLLLLMSVFMFSTILYADPEPRDDGKYEISSWDDLKWLANTPGVWDQDFVQTEPIYADETNDTDIWPNGWTPIGRNIAEEGTTANLVMFTGTYDGQNNVIYNLHLENPIHLNTALGRDGFFGHTKDATIINLGLIDVDITSNANYVGGLIAYCFGPTRVENCFVMSSTSTAGITSVDNSTSATGGLVGYIATSGVGMITNCYSGISVNHVGSKAASSAGGFAGSITKGASLSNCYSYGLVSGNAPNIGGFAGIKLTAGTNEGTTKGCFWDVETSEQGIEGDIEVKGAIGKTTNQMQTKSTYEDADWVFYDEDDPETYTSYWRIDDGESYPYLVKPQHDTLPVELSSFTVNQLVNEGVELRWVAETETNFLGYNIYRAESFSLNDAIKINFTIVPGYNTSVRNSYKYEDTTVEMDKEYFYWLESVDLDLTNEYHGPISIYVSDMAEGGEVYIIPPVTRLVGAYPNPFNPSTNIYFSLDKGRNVSIDIYNAQGQFIKNLCTDKYFDKGNNSLAFTGSNLASGIYYINLRAGTETMTKKMLLLK